MHRLTHLEKEALLLAAVVDDEQQQQARYYSFYCVQLEKFENYK
jgi:hypothetical protein